MYTEENDRERARLKALVDSLTDADLSKPVTPEWSVADMLGHIVFWDGRASMLAKKLAAGSAWSKEDYETEEVDSLNGAVAELLQRLPRRMVANLALEMAADADERVAGLPAERMWPQDRESPLNCERSGHRAEHLDQIEAALRG